MPSLDSIEFDSAPYQFRGDMEGIRVWHTQQGDGIGLLYSATRPDIDAPLDSIDELRAFYRRSAELGGLGVIEIERIEVDGCKAVRTLFKARQQPAGSVYVGSITIPFSRFSYVLKVQCPELGMTGLREAAVSEQLLASGEISVDAHSGTVSGWLSDPYDASLSGPMTRTRAEDPRYDDLFPDHPLSRARKLLTRIQTSARFAAEVRLAPQR
jgi:hypothetical protein